MAFPLFTFGKLSSAREAARAGVRAAGHDRDRALATLAARVREAYYSLQLALDVQQMIAEGQGRLESAARQLEERIEADDPDTNEHDRWRLSTTLAEVEGRRSEAVRLERSARYALQMLSGLDRVRIPDCPIAQVPIELEALRHYEALIDHRPDALMLQAGVAAQRANVTATRARLLPDVAVALSASYSYGPGITDQTNPFIIDSANYTGLGAGVVARWSLDFVGNAQRLRRAHAELEATEAQVEEAQSGMVLEVATTYERVLDAQRRVTAWSRGHRDARAWFVAAASAYQVGASEPRELVDAVRTYFTARFNHLSAIRDFNVALGAMEQATGTPVVEPRAWEAECTE